MKRWIGLVILSVCLLAALVLITMCGDRRVREEDSTIPTIAGEDYSVPEEELYQGVWKDRQVTLKIVDKDGKPVAGAKVDHLPPVDKDGFVSSISSPIGETNENGEVVWENPYKEEVEVEAWRSDAKGVGLVKVKESDLDGVLELKLDMKAHE